MLPKAAVYDSLLRFYPPSIVAAIFKGCTLDFPEGGYDAMQINGQQQQHGQYNFMHIKQ